MDELPATLTVQPEYKPLSTTLDLNLMALDPIGVNSDSAIVGFIPNRFIPLPASSSAVAPKNFKTIATTNDLLIEDTTDWGGAASGFKVSQTCLMATWNSKTSFPYKITLYFKVTDSVSDYTLHMKHWITQGSTGVALTLVVNSGTPDPITISKYVNAPEAEGGENNILSIALRNLDFASVDYHDYLQFGLNSVTIKMEPIEPACTDCTDCVYQIRAISIVKG